MLHPTLWENSWDLLVNRGVGFTFPVRHESNDEKLIDLWHTLHILLLIGPENEAMWQCCLWRVSSASDSTSIHQYKSKIFMNWQTNVGQCSYDSWLDYQMVSTMEDGVGCNHLRLFHHNEWFYATRQWFLFWQQSWTEYSLFFKWRLHWRWSRMQSSETLRDKVLIWK